MLGDHESQVDGRTDVDWWRSLPTNVSASWVQGEDFYQPISTIHTVRLKLSNCTHYTVLAAFAVWTDWYQRPGSKSLDSPRQLTRAPVFRFDSALMRTRPVFDQSLTMPMLGP